MNREDIDKILDDYLSDYHKRVVKDYIEEIEQRIYKARKIIFDNYGLLDKYEVEMLDDILKGVDKE